MNDFQRARAPQQKADRRDAILSAAATLLQQRGELPTAAQTAAACGLAKGTIYLYFRTKEEIYLALLERTMLQFLQDWQQAMQQRKKLDGNAIADTLLTQLQAHREFVPLAALSQNILEQNASSDALLAHKRAVAAGFTACAQVIVERSQLKPERTRQLLLCSYSLITGLWQCANPPACLRDEEFALFVPEFAREAELALRQLWRD